MPNNIILDNEDSWDKDELDIFKSYDYRCALCNDKAIVLHEIIFKSHAIGTWKRAGNRVPLCNSCHEKAHSRASKQIRIKLLEIAKNKYGNN
jgi:5-methylcytosine-specific restriction endonuclease McrA